MPRENLRGMFFDCAFNWHAVFAQARPSRGKQINFSLHATHRLIDMQLKITGD